MRDRAGAPPGAGSCWKNGSLVDNTPLLASGLHPVGKAASPAGFGLRGETEEMKEEEIKKK